MFVPPPTAPPFPVPRSPSPVPISHPVPVPVVQLRHHHHILSCPVAHLLPTPAHLVSLVQSTDPPPSRTFQVYQAITGGGPAIAINMDSDLSGHHSANQGLTLEKFIMLLGHVSSRPLTRTGGSLRMLPGNPADLALNLLQILDESQGSLKMAKRGRRDSLGVVRFSSRSSFN